MEKCIEVMLDACPPEMIRRFIKRSWRFIEAYRRGLDGKAAAWAIKQQKTHCSASGTAMVAIESVAEQ